ncbi:phytoene/squalene synthase family protein [Kitasatospora sp. NPDC058397]|uniref:phytoene/squalene synthase family protein n=1 Tax=unclassified Kitasatospora TaxID=2633591 RepID=UPI0036502030
MDRWSLDRAGITDHTLRESYEFCRRMLISVDGRTYWAASCCAPPAVRPHLWAAYAFGRHADQLVDGGDRPGRAEEFERWAEHLTAALEDGDGSSSGTGDPITRALTHTVHSRGIRVEDLMAYVDGLRMDLSPAHYPTFAELRPYLRAVGGAPARILLRVFEDPSPAAEQAMTRLGEAAQFTDIVCDIAEDLRMGRLYLPLEDLERFGLTRDDLAAEDSSAAVRELLRFEVSRARELWEEGLDVLDLVHPTSRAAWQAGAALLRAPLDRVERRGNQAVGAKDWTTAPRTAAILVRSLLHPPVGAAVPARP